MTTFDPIALQTDLDDIHRAGLPSFFAEVATATGSGAARRESPI